MTDLLDGTADTVGMGRRRRDADEPRLVDAELADRLIARAQSQGVQLLGEGGLLKQMTKAILERSLAVELTDHLGYDEGDPAGAGSGNSRHAYPLHSAAFGPYGIEGSVTGCGRALTA